MIIQAFLRWVETAKTTERCRAAHALGKAFAGGQMSPTDRKAAEVAMTFLLDDPSPKVRLVLAQAVADVATVPRCIILPLAEDQPEIACEVIARSPVLSDSDLVDLAAKGTPETRAVIAARSFVSRPLAAALAEIGGEEEILVLLENDNVVFSARTLKRLCDRLGHVCAIRSHLLERTDLPVDARHSLIEKVASALSGYGLVQAAVGELRVHRIAREACDSATVAIAATTETADMPLLVEHLRVAGRLTPAFLMHTLCRGNVEFLAASIVNLSGYEDKRVRSILSGGRIHALRALLERAGLGRDISILFADAILLWRTESRRGGEMGETIPQALLAKLRHHVQSTVHGGMADMIERLTIAQERQSARDYAYTTARGIDPSTIRVAA